MKLKTVEIDGKTLAEVKDGKPVFIEDDGTEIAFDAPHTKQTIERLNGEAKGHRQAKEALEKAMKPFEGLDPDQARKAMETVSNLDTKRLIDAGEKDAAIAAAIKPFQEQIESLSKEREELAGTLDQAIVGGAFSQSKYIREKMAIPADLVQSHFGKNFRREGDTVYAVDKDGNKLHSRERPGEYAGFDEAMGILVENYQFKDHILKGSGSSGSGASQSAASMGQKVMTQAQFNQMGHAERSEKLGDGYRIVEG